MRSRRPPYRRAAGATPDRLTQPLPVAPTALLACIGALGAALVLLRVSGALADPQALRDEAFEIAFGMTVDDFHAAFAAYRAGQSF